MSSLLSASRLSQGKALYATLGLTSLTTILLIRYLSTNTFRSPPSHSPQWIDGPLKTLLPKLSPKEKRKLAYPPNALPGARDIDTPYGSIRIYEWGPEDGERVLFLHGISTPSVAFANLAPRLVEKGYRVMLFDLFGRGLSDAPLLPYSAALYTSQILLATTSSPLPWPSFHLIGYSLGGCLAAHFAASFPARVHSLTALAPAGLLAYEEMSWRTRVMYSEVVQALLPGWARSRFVRGRLWSPPEAEADAAAADAVGLAEGTGEHTRDEALADGVEEADEEYAPRSWTPADCNAVVNESLEVHAGLPLAFVSSLQHAPIYGQEETWARIECRVLMVLGSRDPIIKPAEYGPTFEGLFGVERRKLVMLDAGHELPISKSEECAEAILDFWRDGK